MIRQGASSVNASASAVAASSSIRAWGQQCSEHCGCAIRFEMTMDPLTQVITSARYIAKQVVGSKRQQPSAPPSHRPQQQQKTAFTRTTMLPLPIPQWNPQYTFGGSRQKQQHGQQHGQQLQPPKRRPLITTCSCSTLQQLANQVTQHLPHHTLDQIRNELEFTMPRSSLAVSHTILRQQQLPVNHTHCWDVLEEALTAMIKGYLPRPRRMVHVRVPRQQPDDLPGPLDDDDDDNISPWEESSQRISSPTSTESPSQDTHHHTTSLLDVNYYNDKNPHNDQGWEHRNSYSYHPFHGHHESSSSSSSSPLDMMNMMYSMSPSLQHQVDNIRRPHRRSNYSSSFYDWVSYVDELRHQEEEEEEEQSA
jgi:NifU-like protein involved in Fe-S cluster formation